MAYDGNSPMLTMGAKIVQITHSPIFLKITRHNKTQDRDEERYWLEQHMSKEAVQKVLSGQFKDGDEINITIDKTKRFDGGIQLLVDIASKKGEEGYKRPYDPEVEKRRQESIERQNARNIAKDILILCFEQYPVSAHQDNYEKAISLFHQLMQIVRQGEEILMRGE